MKANEFMIGDWVICGGVTQKVTHITEGFVCHPIPLTKEILKLNGWVNRTDENFGDNSCIVSDIFKGRNRWHPKKKQEEFCLISFDNGTFGLLICGVIQQLEYAHELQHALRLCGLNELADNFKVG